MTSESHDLLWRALSDPTRRHIMDLLRAGPRTTGDLCAAFGTSRFAVMKHLGVLQDAGLVLVRRRGRQRWNHLNAVPLYEIAARWLGPFQAAWAAGLTHLRDVLEQPHGSPSAEGNAMPTPTADQGRPGVLSILQEITIAAPRQQVFAALTNDVGAWWGRPYLLDADRAVSLALEPRLGGHFVERWGEDEGAIWCTVTAFCRDELLELQGTMGMSGAVFGTVELALGDAGPGHTRLRLSHRAVGETDGELAARYEAGWRDLLDRRLRAWVERGEPMGLGHEPAGEPAEEPTVDAASDGTDQGEAVP